jgi:2-polyprenyl-3-methyl-5-hydroxy-6-metoxy-1,4-benzoquinol methylase
MADPEQHNTCPLGCSSDTRFFASARDLEYFTTPEKFRYDICCDCETVFLVAPPVDRLHEIYPTSYYSYAHGDEQSGSFEERIKEKLDLRMFRNLLDQVPGDALSVLDVGGGSGWLLTQIRNASDRVVETHEVDIDESARASAEKQGHHFHCTPIQDFAPGRRFDVIIMLNLIEHVADPAALLRSMRGILSERGVILVKTPNTDTLDRRLFQHRNWGGFHCPRHWVLFTMPGLRDLALRCGLETARASYTQGGPQWAASIMAWLYSRGLISMSAERIINNHPMFMVLAAFMAGFDMLRMPFAPTAQMVLIFKPAMPQQGSPERPQ